MDAPTSPARRVQRVRYELKRRDLAVLRRRVVGAHFVELVLGGDDLAGFQSAGFDDHVKLFFPAPGGGDPVGRDYTPRRYDAQRNELTIEFLLHGHGAASDWARAVQPGDRLVVGGPRGSMVVPTDYAWHAFAGDETALPAISRRLEELPAGSRAFVIAQAADDADRRHFDSAAEVEVTWVRSSDELLTQAAAMSLPEGEGYVWAAGEAAVIGAPARGGAGAQGPSARSRTHRGVLEARGCGAP